jgi:hypothetical protein
VFSVASAARMVAANAGKGVKNRGTYIGYFMYPQKKKSGSVRSRERGGQVIRRLVASAGPFRWKLSVQEVPGCTGFQVHSNFASVPLDGF